MNDMERREDPGKDEQPGGPGPSPQQREEDLYTARLVARVQAGETDAFGEIYQRYFDRVYKYLMVLLRHHHDAEDAAQQAFTQAFARIGEYEQRTQPFRSWLFATVRNLAIDELRRRHKIDVEPPEEMDRLREGEGAELTPDDPGPLGWITDSELTMFVERLPLHQRQILLLRFLLDLQPREIAKVLDRTPNEVSALLYRSTLFLRKRLAAIGRGSSGDGGTREPMRARVKALPVLRRRRFSL